MLTYIHVLSRGPQDDWAQSQAKWYDPRSWFQRSNSEQDQGGAMEGLGTSNGNRRPVAGAELIKSAASGPGSDPGSGEGGWSSWLSRLVGGQKTAAGVAGGGTGGGRRSSFEMLAGIGSSLGGGNQVGGRLKGR